MIGSVGASPGDIREAVLALSRSIAGRNDLESLLSGVANSLRRVVNFEYLALVLHDSEGNRMRLHALNSSGPVQAAEVDALFAVEQDPDWCVWESQQPLVISNIDEESRWPEFVQRLKSDGIHAVIFVPLTAGENRLGMLAFGCLAPFAPSPDELAFLERVASEFAVAVEAHLAKRQLVRERDRIRALFDITNALVSNLSPNKLFSAISEQLSRVIKHDVALLTICNGSLGGLDLYALHFPGEQLFSPRTSGTAEGMPTAEALATGNPVVMQQPDFDRFPSPDYRRFAALGFKASCSIPLITPNRTIGTLEIARTTGERWTEDDLNLLVQVARQIAVAVENSLSYRELAEMKERLATEKLYLEDEIRSEHNFGNMLGECPAFQSVLQSIHIVAPTPATVLILGETGTGKELVAHAIHDLSGRAGRSFVKVNCAAIPATLLESELFGHEKGAFTGASGQKLGRFELADGGTLFLDEIGELPLELQPKLLRAIQDQEFERVGGTRTVRVDVRLIAATNRDLKAMVDEGRFRADLYYRLHVFPLTVPPLRERREDIPLLARHFVQKYARRMNRRIHTIPAAAMDYLTRYEWPGNIRELQNLIERSVIVSSGSALTLGTAEFRTRASGPALQSSGSDAAASAEREGILRALKQANGIVGGPNGAAALLGIKRTTLQSRMRKYGIARQYS